METPTLEWIQANPKEALELILRLQGESTTDSLTGLANRRGLEQEFSRVFAKIKRDNSGPYTLVYFDLNKFKPINDTYGHNVGDEALCYIADQFRESDFAARVGGDEFSVIIKGGQKEVSGFKSHLLKAFTRFQHNGIKLPFGASFGSCRIDSHLTASQIIDAADKAMFLEKGAGRAA